MTERPKGTLSLGRGARVPYPLPTTPGVTAAMVGNRSTDTRGEVRLRSELHRLGYRFRKNFRIVTSERACRADIVFTARRVVVFFDGCFWHACPTHGRNPTANQDYWGPKLARNVERDELNRAALEREGWRVVRIWEHEELSEAVRIVLSELERSDLRG